MKKHLFLILLAGIFAAINLNPAFGQDQKKKEKEKEKKESVTFYVEGMNCKNCQAKIEQYIAFEKGVTGIECNLEKKLVVVSYNGGKTDPKKIQKGFEKIKFPAVIVPKEADEASGEEKKKKENTQPGD